MSASPFLEACRALCDAAAAPQPDRAAIRRLGVEVSKRGASVGIDELSAEAQRLRRLVDHEDPVVAAEAAITLGCFLEYGLPPNLVGSTIVARTSGALSRARPYHQALVAEFERAGEGAVEAKEDEVLWGGDYQVTRETARAIAKGMPAEADAYFALKNLCLPTIAALTRDADLRKTARANAALVASAAALRNDAAGFLHQLLVGVGTAEWIVLYAPNRKGFVVRAHEIVDNWVLQPLLANALVTVKQGGFLGFGGRTLGPPDGLAGRRPPADLVACFQGRGPNTLPDPAYGQWEAYTFRAIGKDGKLRESQLDNKIWNEGIPIDIPELDGHRVVVLGAQMIERSWNAGRTFAALGSDIEHVRTLSRDESEQWFERCAKAKQE